MCRRGDDDENLLLCDGCDRGCHLYCHRPRMAAVPEGDWFCSVCVSRVRRGGVRAVRRRRRGRVLSVTPCVCVSVRPSLPPPLLQAQQYPEPLTPRRGKKRKRGRVPGGGAAEEDGSPRRRAASRRPDGASPAKRRAAPPRGPPGDLTFCE